MSEWIKEYDLGIPSIDEQHLRFFDMIQNLLTINKAKDKVTFLKDALTQIEMYTQYHFGYEESLLLEHQYPGLKEHQAEHSNFKAEVKEIVARFATEDYPLGSDVAVVLRRWLISHILKTDKEYAPFLIQKGCK